MFILTKYSNAKTGKIHYSVQLRMWPNGHSWGPDVVSNIRNHFDPGKNRGSTNGLKWKFNNRKEAEQLIMTAIIKWS